MSINTSTSEYMIIDLEHKTDLIDPVDDQFYIDVITDDLIFLKEESTFLLPFSQWKDDLQYQSVDKIRSLFFQFYYDEQWRHYRFPIITTERSYSSPIVDNNQHLIYDLYDDRLISANCNHGHIFNDILIHKTYTVNNNQMVELHQDHHHQSSINICLRPYDPNKGYGCTLIDGIYIDLNRVGKAGFYKEFHSLASTLSPLKVEDNLKSLEEILLKVFTQDEDLKAKVLYRLTSLITY